MTSAFVTSISFLCTVLGLCASAAYAVTFYLINYNELYLTGQSGYDETDLPYTYAIVECAVSGCTFLVGVLAFSSSGRPTKNAAMIALIFFAVASILEGTFGMLRGWNLGLIGDDMQKTCSDISQSTGCPTTRFEHVHEREITYTTPSGGDCVFWFWGDKPATGAASSTSMTRLIDIVKTQCTDTACATRTYSNTEMAAAPSGQYFGLEARDIETYMDWSEATSYGWRDDPDEIANIGTTSANLLNLETLMLNKRHNMQQLMDFQAKILIDGSENIAVADRLTEAPSLAYCWYWGCNAVCHHERYLVNRWWLYSSIVLFVFQIMNVILTSIVWKRTPSTTIKYEGESIDTMDEEEDLEMVPSLGRRKRQLVQNPSGLMF